MMRLFKNAHSLIHHVLSCVHEKIRAEAIFSGKDLSSSSTSAVLLLLSQYPDQKRFEPSIVLNKRSQNVKQPGDLCCPGGSISSRFDAFLSDIVSLPVFPLGRWPYWSDWRNRKPKEARALSLLFATGLREAFEEMRLNPLGVKFLGPLPSQRLNMFQRTIFPLAVWISSQKRFIPNWEVEKVVHISLRDLLNTENYGCLRLDIKHFQDNPLARPVQDFPCFRHNDRHETELLWGATYRIVTVFLDLVFGFKPPPALSLPVFHGTLDDNYLNGAV